MAWWYLVLCILLLISGVESNPGPKKGRRCQDSRSSTDNERQHKHRSKLTHETTRSVTEHATLLRRTRRASLPGDQVKETRGRKLIREALTQEQRSDIRMKDTSAKQKKRHELGEDDKQNVKITETRGRKRIRENLTQEQRSDIRMKNTSAKQKKRPELGEDDKQNVKITETRGRTRIREDLTQEQRSYIRMKDTSAKQKKRPELGEDDKQNVKITETRGRKRIREDLTQEQRSDIRMKDTSAKQKKRPELGEDDKQNVKITETRGRKRIRENLTQEQRSDIRMKDTSAKQKKRPELGEDDKQNVKITETRGRKRIREDLTQEQISDIRMKDTSAKQKKRPELEEDDKQKVKITETRGRKRIREDLTQEQRSDIRMKDTFAKQKKRPELGEDDKQKMKITETRGRKLIREDLTQEQRSDIRMKDTSAKQKKRPKLGEDDKQNVKITETRGRKLIREDLTQEQRSDIRIKDTSAKQKKRPELKKKCSDIDFVGQRFNETIKEGPIYDCCCCRRMLYRQSVLCFSKGKYKNASETLLETCCGKASSSSSKSYICKTCDLTLRKNKMPTQAEANNLYFDDVPESLQDLCPLEERLVSQRLPFMQIASLPRGGQKSIKGAVVNVPAQLDNIVKTLPRMPTDCGLVPVKLKKRLEYKGHSMYQSIRPEVVLGALQTLKETNPLYENVDLDGEWLNRCKQEEEKLCAALVEAEQQLLNNSSDSSDESGKESTAKAQENEQNESEKTEDNVDKLRGIPYNTCLQPASEIPGSSVICFAPREGEHPVSLLTDNQCEVLAFPSLFPSGQFGHFDPTRPVNLTCKRYFNQRLLNVDKRCASNVEYLFFAQYYTEIKQVLDNISIAVRLCKPGHKTVAAIKNTIHDMMRDNDAYKFLQTIRGSHPYWKRTLHDLCAMVRQLDIPTWFITFSAADLSWTEPIQIIARQQGVKLTDDEVKNLDWQEKCRWLRSNPVTAARHFEYRTQKFIHGVMMSEAHPVGEITDHFYRVEFQQRDSPHLHCLFWVKDAPKIGCNTDEEVCNFVDNYISCQVPDAEIDPVVHRLVDKVQRHTHSASCSKSGKGCRFHFPKAPTSETLIADVANMKLDNPAHITIRKEENAVVLKKVYESLAEHPNLTFDDLLLQAEVEKDVYLRALRESTASPTIIPAREPADCFINNYSPDLLRIWQANMDIQFVTDPYACAMYILSYVTKGEKQIGELLKRASEQCKEDDSVRQQMKSVGNVFLTHREVSAQEAAYRVLSIPLKMSSRQVVFVNTSMLQDRIRILKPQSQLQNLPDNSTDVYQTGMLERYAVRPVLLENMCLADFATTYKLAAPTVEDQPDRDTNLEEDEGSAITLTKIKLQFGLGMMYKRRKRAVIRTPRFSRVKHPEKFFYSALMLYKPWREEIELMAEYNSYEDYFDAVKDSLEETIKSFESDDCMIDETLKMLQTEGPPTQAWNNLAPEAQQGEDDDAMERKKPSEEHDHMNPGILQQPPELLKGASIGYSIQNQTDIMPTEEFQGLVQRLNAEQRQIFDMIHLWCRQVLQAWKTADAPAPFYTFVTGGAGTGKSHLIKAILNMARKELRPLCDSDDEITVLIAAPTGIAAINVEGGTIHATFSIPVNNYGKSDTISQDKKASMRNSLKNLKIVILDEISMVAHSTFLQIHRRLQDIMGTIKDDVYFGGVSVLAVGDFYQIDPVQKRAVYKNPKDSYEVLNPFHMWKDLFHMAELTQIMRQKDDVNFAQLLNRARIGQLTDKDTEVLKSRIISPDNVDYPHDALHVFPRNIQVDSHNKKMLATLNAPLRHLQAVDASKDLQTGKANVTIPDNLSKTGGLRETVSLCTGCRIMITKNTSVEDGLVNGIQGTVVGFIDNKDKSIHQPIAVLVKFDDPDIGKKQRKMFSQSSIKGATPITPIEARFSIGKYNSVDVTRTQFPLTLAFACTIHKYRGFH